ncbi:MAG: XTP/dITP diphosphatase [Verrucomicrobia bacterium]|nr:MAG: XTP/dITP diphosphatase [Verrucomicrobiota bacterium]
MAAGAGAPAHKSESVMKLIVATRNKHKLEEIHTILKGLNVELHSALDFPEIPDVVEDGDTFEANAIKKAVTLARATGCWALADDSGLEVDALGGAPGVYSARYAGEPVSYPANNEKLLRELAGQKNRRARFRCVMALSDPQGHAETVEGCCEGHIIEELRGTAGFGYDPLFVPDGFKQTFAEMPADQKNGISHRGRALDAAKERWSAILNERGAGSPAHEDVKKIPDLCGRGFQPRETVSSVFPHSADLRKHRYDVAGHLYFVTKRRAANAEIDLSQPPIADEIVQSLFWLLEDQRIWLLGFVLMPDHCHFVLAPRPPFSLKQVLHSLFSFSAQKINHLLHRHGAFWMEEFFERHLLNQEETRKCLEYLHLNPVRKGLVQRAEDWRYSSASPGFHDKMSWAWLMGEPTDCAGLEAPPTKEGSDRTSP